jgi:hypothetical protein
MARSNKYKNLYDYTKAAYSDTVTQYVNKNKELYTANLMYVTDVKDLKKQNEELYAEVKSLKDNPLVVTKIKTIYQIDTIAINSPVTLDTANGNFESRFEYEDEWNSIFGRLNGNVFNNTGVFTLDRLYFNCDITSDIVEKDGNFYFISKSNNPYLHITNTDGYMLSPEKSKALKRRFNKPWGVMIGIGGTLTLYDNSVRFMPGVNLTVGYKILSF